MQRNEAVSPAGPAPTINTSAISDDGAGRLAARRAAIVSTQSLPWFTAFLMRAKPPSSPTMNIFFTLVSYSEVSRGRLAPTLGLANTISIAPTGHESAQI